MSDIVGCGESPPARYKIWLTNGFDSHLADCVHNNLWSKIMEALKVGDMVKYKRTFLKGVFSITDPAWFARGRIVSINGYVATVWWHNQEDEIPPKVHINNITHADDPETASY